MMRCQNLINLDKDMQEQFKKITGVKVYKLTVEGGVQYSKIAEIKGPLVIVDDVENAAFDELVEIETNEGERRLGKVLEVGNGKAIVQVFEGTTGLSICWN